MQRELIEIEADSDGWIVKDIVAVLTCRTKARAILEGHRLARQRYEEAGHPTALKVPVGWGETVMVDACGERLGPCDGSADTAGMGNDEFRQAPARFNAAPRQIQPHWP